MPCTVIDDPYLTYYIDDCILPDDRQCSPRKFHHHNHRCNQQCVHLDSQAGYHHHNQRNNQRCVHHHVRHVNRQNNLHDSLLANRAVDPREFQHDSPHRHHQDCLRVNQRNNHLIVLVLSHLFSLHDNLRCNHLDFPQVNLHERLQDTLQASHHVVLHNNQLGNQRNNRRGKNAQDVLLFLCSLSL